MDSYFCPKCFSTELICKSGDQHQMVCSRGDWATPIASNIDDLLDYVRDHNRVITKKIKKYWDERTGEQWGPVIGLVMSAGKELVGYSVCNSNKGDIYDKYRAEEICLGRMSKDTIDKFYAKNTDFIGQKSSSIAKHVFAELQDMEERSIHYFKEED